MAIKSKYQHKREHVLRDARSLTTRIAEIMRQGNVAASIFFGSAYVIHADPMAAMVADVVLFFNTCYFLWLLGQKTVLPFKLPKTAKTKDKNNVRPDGKYGKADGILYLGNEHDTGEEIWFTNSDARTHILYLGTTGSGKTEGLKSLSTNALCWGSGFIYIDGKADTDLWSSISALARRFGRDDDLLIMNYMTGNAEGRIASNTMNPFSSGSASYLTNMLVSLMPDAEGDNAMWKERAVALASSLMPCLVYRREKQNIPLNVSVIRKALEFSEVIKMSRDPSIPETMRISIHGYLTELPGYKDEVFDDDGKEKPMGPDGPMEDTSVPRQQHGYLSMQFTRSLQSLGDDYAFIFDTQAADIDMMDVVLQRRILITLIPALEKSSDETANLGKIIASTLRGMMGATLGSTVEGASETAIENKPTRSETPFMAIFDEVGYYTAQGMAVMAAQARSLGFCLVYAAQDLPALEKRVKEEARSITANCNIKIFGKLEDPTQTKDFFEKTVGSAYVAEISSYTREAGSSSYRDTNQAAVHARARADYDELRAFKEGRAVCAFGERVCEMQVYYCNPGMAKAMRVQRFLPIIPPGEAVVNSMRRVSDILKRLRSKKWDPEAQQPVTDTYEDIAAIASGFALGKQQNMDAVASATLAVSALAEKQGLISIAMLEEQRADEAENQAIAEEVSDMTGGKAPISWNDIIGGEGAEVLEDQMAQDIAADLSDESAPVKKPLSSAKPDEAAAEDPMYAVDMPDMSQPLPSEPPSGPAPPPVPEQPVQQEAQQTGTENLRPLSWMDIIGADEATVASTVAPAPPQETPPPSQAAPPPQQPAETQQQAAPPPAAPQQPPQEEEQEEDVPVMTWADIIGADETEAAAPPSAPAPSPEAQQPPQQTQQTQAAPPPQEEEENKTLSWADILGTDTDGDDGAPKGVDSRTVAEYSADEDEKDKTRSDKSGRA